MRKKIFQNYYAPLLITRKRLSRLSGLLSTMNYRVETDESEFTSIDELLSGCSTQIYNLEIELQQPIGRVSFLQNSARFNIKQSHGEALEVFTQLDKLFSRWERQPRVIYDISLVTLLNIFIIVIYNTVGAIFLPFLLIGIGWELYLLFYIYTTEYIKIDLGIKVDKIESD